MALDTNALIVPQLQALDQGQQTLDAENAARHNALAFFARLASQTAYHELSPSEALEVDAKAFPEVVHEPAGGPPALPEGARITGYPSDFIASVDMGQGQRAAVDSSQPMAIETAPNQRSPIDLAPKESGTALEPTLSDVAVQIPKHLLSGVELPTIGLSLTPVDEHGLPVVGSEASSDAAVVFFANTQTDADTLIKPTTGGFDAASMLRSPASPEGLYFKLGLPEGATLAPVPNGSGAIQVVSAGTPIATIRSAMARDAAGAVVPVSMTYSGSTISVVVAHHSAEYQYPIYVDPEAIEDSPQDHSRGAWYPMKKEGVNFYPGFWEGGEFYDYGANYEQGDWGAWAYGTQGISRIFRFSATTSATHEGEHDNVNNRMGIIGAATRWETPENEWLGYVYGPTTKTIAPASGGTEGNAAVWQQYATEKGDRFTTSMTNAQLWITQASGPTAGFNTTSETIAIKYGSYTSAPNGLHENAATRGWLRPTRAYNQLSGAVEVYAHDPGIGIDKLTLSSPNEPKWKRGWAPFYEGKLFGCDGVQCFESLGVGGGYEGPSPITAGWECFACELPDGEDTVQITAENAAGQSGVGSATLKVDSHAPSDLSVTGLPANQEIGERTYRLTAYATDGTLGSEVKSSGVKEVYVTIDGTRIGSGAGSCYPGPCTATYSATINGAEYPVGTHYVNVHAVDYAGNESVSSLTAEEYAFTVSHAAPVSLGPGSLNPQTGEFSTTATDVSVASPGSTLTLERTYSSRHPNEGAPGPFGPEWMLSLGGEQSLVKAADGSMVLTDASGEQMQFGLLKTLKFASPPGRPRLTLSEESEGGATVFRLSGASGASTLFRRPSGETGNQWVPAIKSGANETNTTTFAFQTVEVEGEKVVEPIEALAPHAGVDCTELRKGCRALSFNYAKSTTATGEAPSEWGDYEGHLTRVYFHAWDPSTGAMSEPVVAEYLYDKQGRLRAEWNPQITPALKTLYGYNRAGYLTALTPPGEETWALSYGTTASDPNPGRLLSVTRPSANTAHGNAEAPANTVRPTVGSPVEGTPTTASLGTWSNQPVAYSYQWESCWVNTCKRITGATNSTFTPTSAEVPGALRVKVTATNAGGSTAVDSAASEPIQGIVPTYETSLGKGTLPVGKASTSWLLYEQATADAVDVNGNVWVVVASNGLTPSSRVYEFNSAGTVLNLKGYKVSAAATGIAVDSKAAFVYVASPGKIWKLKASTGKLATSFSTGAPSPENQWASVTFDPEGHLWVSECSSGEVEEYKITGERLTHFNAGQGATGIAVDSPHVYVGTHYGPWEPYFDYEGRLRTYTHAGTLLWGNEHAAGLGGIAFEPYNAFVYLVSRHEVTEWRSTSQSGGGVQEFANAWFGAEHLSEADNVAVDTSSHYLYVLDHGSGEVEKWKAPHPEYHPPAPPNPGTSAVWTVNYNVPVSGVGAPNTMGKSEVAAWAQTDLPSEATAIFPPDEPQGWPAQDYRRATIYYLDSSGRTVNVAEPGAAISTNEYDKHEHIVRRLTPGNREAALREGSKSAETSKLLDSETTYNAAGTEMLGTLGPQHTVQLADGTQAQGRQHVQYSYDEGKPAGGPYLLVTKTTEGAQIAGVEEKDVRTTKTSYSGQGGLGWTLHAPTSVATDPGGLNLTHTTLYAAGSGLPTDTIAPAGNAKGGDSHDTRTIYYTKEANATVPACGGHEEWANLPCQIGPAAQPGGSLPTVPVKTITQYNLWDEPETVAETATDSSGTKTRTGTTTYDAAGRVKTASLSSPAGAALPSVAEKYDPESGALVVQRTSAGGTTETLTSTHNALGQLVAYTDADGSHSTFGYDVDGRLSQSSDGKGEQVDRYDPTTGNLVELADSIGKFTASYDGSGNMLTKTYPNGMTATYSYDSSGAATGIEYVKSTLCAAACTWYSDHVVPSIHSQWLAQTSTLQASTQSTQSYTYDAASRLIQVQDTPPGKGCQTRIYEYDADTDRIGLRTIEPTLENKCGATGGTLTTHTYDAADRLTDPGTTYGPFGDATALSAADAGGTALTSAYFSNDLLASQAQNGQNIAYQLDPAGRIRQTGDTGTTTSTAVSHYAGDGSEPSWTEEVPGGSWTRYVEAMGELVASQTSGGAVILQLSNLHGDVVATASASENEVKLLSSYEPTEYGVPRSGSAPAKYSWLGAEQQATELPSGVISMGARTYVPQIGAFEQSDPAEKGVAYPYAAGDPVNNSDPSGEVVVQQPWLEQYLGHPTEVPAPNDPYPPPPPPPMPMPAESEGVELEEGMCNGEWVILAFSACSGVSLAELIGSNTYPGLPAGAQCEGAIHSKRYKKEHPRLCREIEGNPWEPVLAWCWLFPNWFCEVHDKYEATKH